jgi:hypothetical protein
MAVQVSGQGTTLSAPRVALDAATFRIVAPTFGGTFLYDPTPDGRGFIGTVTRPPPVHLTLVLDWWRLLPPEARLR